MPGTTVILLRGATRPRDLEILGRRLKGVELAMPFLTPAEPPRSGARPFNGDAILATGKNVIIIGGGDTAADCLGTCHRQQRAFGPPARLQPPPAR